MNPTSTPTPSPTPQTNVALHLEQLGGVLDDIATRHHMDDGRFTPRTRPELETMYQAARQDLATLMDEVNLAWGVVQDLATRAHARATPRPPERRLIVTPHEYRAELLRGGL